MAGSPARLSAEQAAEVRRAAAREKESDEQKWLRSAMREEIAEYFEDFMGEENGKPRDSGPTSIVDRLFGKATG